MRKYAITAAVFAVLAALVLGVGALVEPQTAVLPVRDDSPCPVTGCASGECHGFGAVPEPDGVTEMVCPEAGCASTECHAWDTLVGRYHQTSDASLNLWLLMPVALVVGLTALVRGLSRGSCGERRAAESEAAPRADIDAEAGDLCEQA